MKVFQRDMVNLKFNEALALLLEHDEDSAFIKQKDEDYLFYICGDDSELSQVNIITDDGGDRPVITKDEMLAANWELWLQYDNDENFIILESLGD